MSIKIVLWVPEQIAGLMVLWGTVLNCTGNHHVHSLKLVLAEHHHVHSLKLVCLAFPQKVTSPDAGEFGNSHFTILYYSEGIRCHAQPHIKIVNMFSLYL